MTNTMLEKAAKAIYDASDDAAGQSEEWRAEEWAIMAETTRMFPAEKDAGVCGYIAQARAALQAIREPSDEMLAPACRTHRPGEPMSEARPEECPAIARRRARFTAMIDAILSEGEA